MSCQTGFVAITFIIILAIAQLFLFYFLFYNNFICKEHRKKGAAREELNPHIQQPPKQVRIKQI